MRTKTIKQTGYTIRGTAMIQCWGGGEGTIQMDETFIPTKELTKTKLLLSINDGRFGCEAITKAWIDVYINYENGFAFEYDRTIEISHPAHLLLAMRGI